MKASVPAVRSFRYLGAFLVLGAIACATAPGGITEGDSDVITRAQLDEIGVADLYQAVERLRPLWLRSRGIRSLTSDTEIAVLRDGAYFGNIDILRTMPADQAVRLEYVDGATVASLVTGRVGTGTVIEAAILVSLSEVPGRQDR